MRKASAFILLSITLFLICGCRKEIRAESIVRDFIYSYGTEGIIYSSDKMIHQEGYIQEELAKKIYVTNGKLPENFAVYLNSGYSMGFEFGAFICKDENERASVIEMCRERIDLLTEGEDTGLLFNSGNIVVYTTAKDKDSAERLIRKIIGSYY